MHHALRANESNDLSILIVDDHRDVADSLFCLLKLWGYRCRVAYDGITGLELAREHRPDCLLIDIEMPGMDGYELAGKVREDPLTDQATIISISACSGEEHRSLATLSGIDLALEKPVDPGELRSHLRMITHPVTIDLRVENSVWRSSRMVD